MKTTVDFTLACAITEPLAEPPNWSITWSEQNYLIGFIEKPDMLQLPHNLHALRGAILTKI